MGSINTDGQNTAVINEGVTIMTASRNSQTSMEVNGHGVFTSLLIEALNGGAADITGHISIAGVYAFIDKALGPWEQRPVFKTNVTRFTSLREIQPQVDMTVLRRILKYFKSEDYQYKLNPSYEPTNKEKLFMLSLSHMQRMKILPFFGFAEVRRHWVSGSCWRRTYVLCGDEFKIM